ncbi:hypothetical protein [Streptomyces sp. NPDC093984]
MVDGRGRLVPDGSLEVTFEVTFEVDGAGELVGVGNGNPHDMSPELPRPD